MPDQSNNMRPDPPRRCRGCGGQHGGVGEGITCLELHLADARRRMLPPSEDELYRAWKRLRESVRAMGPSPRDKQQSGYKGD